MARFALAGFLLVFASAAYTAGHFAEIEMPGYTQFGITGGIFDRGWPGALPVLEKDWKPYLDGQIDLKTAIRNLVRD